MAIRSLHSDVINNWIDLNVALTVDNTFNIELYNKTGAILRVATGAAAPVDNNDGVWIKSGEKLALPAHTTPVEKVWVAFKGDIAVKYWK